MNCTVSGLFPVGAVETCKRASYWPLIMARTSPSSYPARCTTSRAKPSATSAWVSPHSTSYRRSMMPVSIACDLSASQPYIQLANYDMNYGFDRERKRVLISRADDERKYGDLDAGARVIQFLLSKLTGYGYQIRRSLTLLALLYAIGLSATWIASANGDMIPTTQVSPYAIAQPRWNDCTNLYPCVAPPIYAAEATFPLLNLDQRSRWAFDNSTTWGQLGTDLTPFTTVGGWFTATMLVGSLSEFFRRA